MKLSAIVKKAAISVMLATSLTGMAATPKYIFYFIGDGMGVGAVTNAQLYNRTVLGNETPLMLTRMPVGGFATTHSYSSPVTDSAAAGTALATANKTRNGMLGMSPDTVAVKSMAAILHDNGYGVGLVTTVAPDDATPGAFYAHVPYRGMFYEIGKDAAASGYEFIAGANLRGTKDKDGKPNDLIKVLNESGVEIVRGTDNLRFTDSRRVMLLSPDTPSMNEIGLTVDSIPGAMLLQDMTQACIDHLMKTNPDKFFMMVEGGSIDHAGHANDAATSVTETISFSKALEVAYNFYEAHPEETLIVVTADHETGGMITANRNHHYWVDLSALKYQRIAKDSFANLVRNEVMNGHEYTWPEMKEFLKEKMGFYSEITLTEEQDASLRQKFEENFTRHKGEEQKTMYNAYNAFTTEVFDIMNRLSGIGWTTNDHSGTMVPVYAAGVDAMDFSGTMDNTEIPSRILKTVGLSF